MRQFGFVLALGAILGFLALPGADAASTSSVARLGTTHGAARLTAGGPNTVYVNAKSLSPGTWTVRLYLGTCAHLTTRIVTLPSLAVGTTHAASRTYAISASQARLGKAGVLLLARGLARVCGAFNAVAPVRSPSPPPSGSPGSSPTPSTSPSASGKPAPTPAPGTIMVDLNGRGSTSTATFTAPTNWEIDYQFDCGGGAAPGFAIAVSGSAGTVTVVNSSGTGGSASRMLTNMAGSVHLEITTACAWQVLAIAD